MTDDEEFCIASMRAILGQAHIDTVNQVDFCITGLESLTQVKKCCELGLSYKLILTDFSMPEMDGIEATVKIREYLTSKGIARE